MSKKAKSVEVTPVASSLVGKNQVTLFSNGIGHFRRVYKVPAGQEKKISIPFNSAHVDDALSSLSVFGAVKYTAFPSFSPVNSNSTSLKIDKNNALRSLLSSLSGAEVKITQHAAYSSSGPNANATYTLVGLEVKNTQTDNGTTQETFVILNGKDGVSYVSADRIQNVTFMDASVNAEIAKALKNNFHQIKPDSTFLDLSIAALDLEGNGQEETAVLQYTNPVAAWKMRYSIRSDNGKYFLEGTAIIDNNTDEDWNDFYVSVVTGNPISFSTDLATVTMPQRKRVNLVDNMAMGNVAVEEAMYSTPMAAPARGLTSKSAHKRAARMSETGNMVMHSFSSAPTIACAAGGYPGDDEYSLHQGACGDGNYLSMNGPAAEAPGVDTKEVGDFCVFTSKDPISVASRRSTMVPMFTVALTTASSVLLYKEEDHQRRPFRALKFKNESDFSLGRGKVVIYQEGVFQGECILETTKSGETRMLPHCLENGVKIVKEHGQRDNFQSSVSIANGMGVSERVDTQVVTYSIENKKDEEFKLLLEHNNNLHNPTYKFEGVEVLETEKLTDGVRAYLVLAPKEKLKLTIQERSIASQTINIKNNFGWIQAYVINPETTLGNDMHIKKCSELQLQINEAQEDIQRAQDKLDTLTEQVARSRENLKAISNTKDSLEASNWIKDLDESEKEIRKLTNNTLPERINKERKLTKALADEILLIEVSWKKL